MTNGRDSYRALAAGELSAPAEAAPRSNPLALPISRNHAEINGTWWIARGGEALHGGLTACQKSRDIVEGPIILRRAIAPSHRRFIMEQLWDTRALHVDTSDWNY